jgi:hypothetical protein
MLGIWVSATLMPVEITPEEIKRNLWLTPSGRG